MTNTIYLFFNDEKCILTLNSHYITRRTSLCPYLATIVRYFILGSNIHTINKSSILSVISQLARPNNKTPLAWCVSPPTPFLSLPEPLTEAKGPPLVNPDPLHQETIWQRPNKRSDGEEMDRQENHMDKPGNPHLLQAFRKELVRDNYNHISNPGWNFKWTIPGIESRQDSTPNLDPFQIIHQSYRWMKMAR